MSKKNESLSDEAPSSVCESCATRQLCMFYALPSLNGKSVKPKICERILGIGETLEEQGGISTKVGVVKVGLLKGLRSNGHALGKPIVFLGRGRMVGLSGACRLPAQLSLVASVPTRVCELDMPVFNELVSLHNTIQEGLLRQVGIRMGCIAEWSRILREENHLQRLCNALQLIAAEEGNPAFRIPSHADLASLLSSRRETVARSMATLIKHEKFLKMGRWHGILLSTNCDI